MTAREAAREDEERMTELTRDELEALARRTYAEAAARQRGTATQAMQRRLERERLERMEELAAALNDALAARREAERVLVNAVKALDTEREKVTTLAVRLDAAEARHAGLVHASAHDAPELFDVCAERNRQRGKGYLDTHDFPDGTGEDGPEPEDWIKSGSIMRELCERAFREGRGTWAHILLEEVAEACDETDPAALRTELIQVAAVCVRWARALRLRVPGGPR